MAVRTISRIPPKPSPPPPPPTPKPVSRPSPTLEEAQQKQKETMERLRKGTVHAVPTPPPQPKPGKRYVLEYKEKKYPTTGEALIAGWKPSVYKEDIARYEAQVAAAGKAEAARVVQVRVAEARRPAILLPEREVPMEEWLRQEVMKAPPKAQITPGITEPRVVKFKPKPMQAMIAPILKPKVVVTPRGLELETLVTPGKKLRMEQWEAIKEAKIRAPEVALKFAAEELQEKARVAYTAPSIPELPRVMGVAAAQFGVGVAIGAAGVVLHPTEMVMGTVKGITRPFKAMEQISMKFQERPIQTIGEFYGAAKVSTAITKFIGEKIIKPGVEVLKIESAGYVTEEAIPRRIAAGEIIGKTEVAYKVARFGKPKKIEFLTQEFYKTVPTEYGFEMVSKGSIEILEIPTITGKLYAYDPLLKKVTWKTLEVPILEEGALAQTYVGEIYRFGPTITAGEFPVTGFKTGIKLREVGKPFWEYKEFVVMEQVVGKRISPAITQFERITPDIETLGYTMELGKVEFTIPTAEITAGEVLITPAHTKSFRVFLEEGRKLTAETLKEFPEFVTKDPSLRFPAPTEPFDFSIFKEIKKVTPTPTEVPTIVSAEGVAQIGFTTQALTKFRQFMEGRAPPTISPELATQIISETQVMPVVKGIPLPWAITEPPALEPFIGVKEITKVRLGIKPIVDIKQITEVRPIVDIRQITEVRPIVDVRQITEVRPIVDVRQITEVRPIVDVRQITEVRPIVDVRQIFEPRAVTRAQTIMRIPPPPPIKFPTIPPFRMKPRRPKRPRRKPHALGYFEREFKIKGWEKLFGKKKRKPRKKKRR